MNRILLGTAAILTVVAGTLLVLTFSPDNATNGAVETGTVNVATIGGDFTLTDENGNVFTRADLLGKPSALFFGFTHCPDVCPTTLYELSALMERLGPAADDMNFVFVSVDWEADGPAELAQYTSAFDERIIGLSGTEAQIDQITQAYRVFYEKVPTDDGYTIDHQASVYLMDADGEFRSTITYMEDPDVALQKLQLLVGDA